MRISFKTRPNHIAILKNSSWLFTDKLLRLGLGVLVGAWVARYLGPLEFGELAFALAYIALFQSIANLGLDGIAVRDITQNESEAHSLLGTVFILRLCAGFFCWLSAVVGVALLKGFFDQSVLLTALVGSSLVFQAADTVDLWFQSQSQSRLTLFAKLTTYIVSNGCRIALILVGAPLVAFASIIFLEGLLSATGLALVYKSFSCDQHWSHSKLVAKRLLHESWPFMLSGVSIVIYMRIDQIMIREMLGPQQLGIFAAVLPLATLWQVIPVILNVSLAPHIARKKEESEAAYWLALQKVFVLYALPGWLITIPTIVSANWIVAVLFGPQYSEGAKVLSIYVLTNLFINMGMAQSLWMLNEGKSTLTLVSTLTGVLVCLVGNYFAIPRYGITGVAVIAVLAQLSSAVLINIFFARRIFIMQVKSLAWPIFKLCKISLF